MKRVIFLLIFILTAFSLEDWVYIVGVNGNRGILAKLHLKIINGSGNVYVDTFPLTKVDTQASAMIAKDVACEILNVNCSKYDFLYRIEGSGEIVGGPSAGAAMTVLTMALLSNTTLRKDVVITGAISPDWSIGPVGGIKYKYLAAKNVSKIFLIPYGEKTKEIEEIEEGTKIIEVKDILEAFYYFTGRKIVFERRKINESILEDILKKSAEKICKKAEFYEYLGGFKSKFLERAKELMKEGKYYSAASYCVRTIKDAYQNYLIKKEDVIDEIQKINESINELKNKTIRYDPRDIELVFIFYDRLYSAEEYLRKGIEDRDLEEIAVAKAKLEASKSWLETIREGNETFRVEEYKDIAKVILERARINVLYASTFMQDSLIVEAEKNLEEAERSYEEGNYVETIFKSKEAEALAELSLELLQDKEKLYEKYDEISKKKIEIELGRGSLPVLALSYREYGKILKNESLDLAIYFLKLSTKFSSLPSEIKEKGVLKETPKIEEERTITSDPWFLILPLTLVILVFAFWKF